jgi:hypothetical protein
LEVLICYLQALIFTFIPSGALKEMAAGLVGLEGDEEGTADEQGAERRELVKEATAKGKSESAVAKVPSVMNEFRTMKPYA